MITDLWGNLAGLSLALIIVGFPILLLGMVIAEFVVSMVTDGDFKGRIVQRSDWDEFKFELLGGLELCKTAVIIGFPLLSIVITIVYTGLCSDAMFNSGNPFGAVSPNGYTLLNNPFTQVVGSVVLTVGIVYINLLFARSLYRVGKAVKTLSGKLEDHVKDKEAHK